MHRESCKKSDNVEYRSANKKAANALDVGAFELIASKTTVNVSAIVPNCLRVMRLCGSVRTLNRTNLKTAKYLACELIPLFTVDVRQWVVAHKLKPNSL